MHMAAERIPDGRPPMNADVQTASNRIGLGEGIGPIARAQTSTPAIVSAVRMTLATTLDAPRRAPDCAVGGGFDGAAGAGPTGAPGAEVGGTRSRPALWGAEDIGAGDRTAIIATRTSGGGSSKS